MPLTPERRAEINRENAKKSTGPKTEEGKNASRRNALTHGLRAEALPLPHEDPEAVKARADAWNDYYRPQSPAAQHLVNQCVNATLLADRVNAYQAAAVSRQVRETKADRALYAREEVGRFLAHFEARPAVAVLGLSRLAQGCRHLIYKWEDLRRALTDRGHWVASERDLATRLQGSDPKAVPADPGAWTTGLLALLCQGAPPRHEVAAYFAPDFMPDVLGGAYRPDALPPAATCRQTLLDLIDERLADLRARQAGHDRDEAAASGEAPALALMPPEGEEARLFLRYHAEARNTFHRAYGELVKTLALDAERAADGPPEVPARPAPPDAPPAPEAPAPNEADFPPRAAGPASQPPVRSRPKPAVVPFHVTRPAGNPAPEAVSTPAGPAGT